MKKFQFIKAAAPILGLAALCFSFPVDARRLVLLHTNDTHSQIEPDVKGVGGALQRKAILDSVRNAEKNVITIDAGDMVQGSVYFKYFRGDVEYPVMNMTGYDIRVLGNHEFDNGMAELADQYRQVKGIPLSANYDFSGTELDGIFKPYIIKKVDGKKIGFFGLNVDPKSLISEKNIHVNFKEIIPTANEMAAFLKKDKGCDVVVAVTHIGYVKENDKTTDVELAQASHDIDIIIGGHSHTLIDPENPGKNPSIVKNADGKPVRIAQTGKYGKYIGKITIDLDNLKGADGEDFGYELIPVTDRFPQEQLDQKIIDFVRPYKLKVDSINSKVIGKSLYDLNNSDRNGGFANLTADFGYQYGNHIADSLRAAGMDIGRVDLTIMNVGGIRQKMTKGDITEGQIMSTYPFSNKFTIVALKGADIIEALKVGARKGGEAVSHNVRVVTDGKGGLVRVVIDGNEMDPEKTYLLGTIDYVAEGNDDLVTLANHKKIWTSSDEVSVPILMWFRRQAELGLPIAPDLTGRFQPEIKL